MQRMQRSSGRLVVPMVALVAATALLGVATSRAGTRTITPPTISSFSPLKGAVGRLVTITGTALKGTAAVRFGKVYTMFTVVSGTTITANVPPGAVTAPIRVTKGMVTVASATPFTVVPKITSFSPVKGAVGTLVTIKGTT